MTGWLKVTVTSPILLTSVIEAFKPYVICSGFNWTFLYFFLFYLVYENSSKVLLFLIVSLTSIVIPSYFSQASLTVIFIE